MGYCFFQSSKIQLSVHGVRNLPGKDLTGIQIYDRYQVHIADSKLYIGDVRSIYLVRQPYIYSPQKIRILLGALGTFGKIELGVDRS